jgi:hypothetical protein
MLSQKTPSHAHRKGAGRVAQVVGPEFNVHTTNKKLKNKKLLREL